MRANALARPEQTQTQLEIIRAALRDAALAQSDQVALDILGDTLLTLAGVTPQGECPAFTVLQKKGMEVRHG